MQENGGAYSGHQLPRRPTGPGTRGFTNIVQGSASYVTGSHSAKFGFRWHGNDANYPVNFYNDSQLKYIFQDGVPNQVTRVRRRELAPGTEAEHVRVVCAGSLDARALSLQGGLRFEHLSDYFPQQQMGPNLFLPTALVSRRRTVRSSRRT